MEPKENKIVNNRLEYLTFYVNNVKFAINSLYIDSVVSIDNIASVPCSNNIIDGIVSFRGTAIPVVNLFKYLFNIDTKCKDKNYCIVCKLNDKYYAFRIDDVSNIVTANSIDIIEVDNFLKYSCTMLEGFLADENRNITEILNIKHIIGQCE